MLSFHKALTPKKGCEYCIILEKKNEIKGENEKASTFHTEEPPQVSLSGAASLYLPPSVSPCHYTFHQMIQILVLTTFSFLSYHLLFNLLKHFMPCKVS